MKRFACHITAHTAVEAIFDLRNQNKISGKDVASVEIAGERRMATTNNIPAPSDIMLGQFSIPFCVALALYRNPINLFHLTMPRCTMRTFWGWRRGENDDCAGPER